MATRIAPTIYFIRHGQSQFNAIYHHVLDLCPNAFENRCIRGKSTEGVKLYDIFTRDPHLTPLGVQQAEQTRQRLIQDGILPKLDLIFTSPLTRAVQTTFTLFRPKQSNERQDDDTPRTHAPILLTPLIAEKATLITDMGMPLSRLRDTYASTHDMDLSLIEDEHWWYGGAIGENGEIRISHYHTLHVAASESDVLEVSPPIPIPSMDGFQVQDATSDKDDESSRSVGIPSDDIQLIDHVITTEPMEHVDQRIQQFMHQLRSIVQQRRPQHIAIISHSDFLLNLTDQKMQNAQVLVRSWDEMVKQYPALNIQ